MQTNFYVKAKAQSSEPTIVFIGASNTEEGAAANLNFVSLLKELGEPWASANIINEAKSGWGYSEYNSDPSLITQKISNHNPDYVFITNLIGNDVSRGYGANVNSSMRFLWDTILAEDVNNKIKEVFINVSFWCYHYENATQEFLDEFYYFTDLHITTAQEYGFIPLSYNEARRGHPEYFNPWDCHFTDVGHIFMAEQYDRLTANIIEPGSRPSDREFIVATLSETSVKTILLPTTVTITRTVTDIVTTETRITNDPESSSTGNSGFIFPYFALVILIRPLVRRFKTK